MAMLMIFLAIFVEHPALANEIALTFDDAPRGAERLYTAQARTQQIIRVLRKHGIQTVFFSNPAHLETDHGRERMNAYANAGHLIANHTHSHPDARKVPVEDYLKNFDEADQRLRQR